jgi:hypothetical protein
MKQKYLILKTDEKTKLIIREFAELDKERFSPLCEETFDDESVKSAIAKGQKALISMLRTKNMFPIGIYAKEIASAVTKMYESGDDQSIELFFNDYDLLSKEQEKQATVDKIENKPDEIDNVLEKDVPSPVADGESKEK